MEPTPAATTEVAEQDEEEVELNVRGILLRVLIAMATIMIVMAAVGYFLQDQLIAISEGFVGALGGFGITLGFFLADSTVLPIPHDAFTTFGVLAGIAFWEAVAWASLGSLTGATVGFGIGRYLSHTSWYRRIMGGARGREVEALAKRYGIVALLVGCLGPINYSLVCWATGAMKTPFRHFALVTLLRIPRVAIYLYLIQLGLMSVVD